MVVKSKQFGGKKRKNAANGLDSKKGGKKHHEPTNKRKKPKIEMDDSAQEDDSDEEDDFPEADEDMSDSEDEETGGNVHKPPAQLEIASDEEDFEDEEKGVPKAKVTLKMVSGWTCDLRTKQADELFRVAKEAVDAFLASVESASGKTEANLPKKKRKKGKDGKAAVDDKKNLPRSKYFIQGDNVFNAVVQMCLLDLLPAVNRYLKVSMKAPNDPKEKDACKSKIRQLTTAKNWKRMSGLLRSYSKAVFRLLDSLGDSDALVAVLKHVHQLAPYFLACERVSLTKAFLRSLVRLWSSSSSDPARLLAFMCILRIVRHDAGGMLDWTMKVMYKNYVRHCKFAQNPESAKWINFMKRTMTELYGLDEALAYRHGFVYVRQLAIHLRNATTLKTKNAKDTVLNWQYLHSLDFWGHAVGTLASSDVMSSLIYPLTQVAIGTIAVTDSPKFYPMRFHCVRILVELGRRTGTYIPTLPYTLDILNRLSARLSKKAGTAGSVTFEFDRLVKVPASQVTHRAFLDACFEGLYGLLMESVHSVCHSVAFPEIVFPAANQIRMALKKVKVINFTRRLKVLLDKINDNVKFVEEARSKQKMSLTDQTTIKAVETQLQQSGKSPFGNFFRGWKAEQDKRNALLHAEEINIDTLKNANAKRMEAREKAQQEKMEKQKKADRRQLKGLFVNNSDEEEEVEEKPKKKKKKKPVKEEPAEEEPPKKKQKPEVPSAPYVDKGDIVEELDVDAFEESSEEEEEEEEEEVVEKPKVKAKKPKPGKNQKKGKKVKLEDSDDSGSDLGEDDVEFDSDEDDDDDDEDGEEDDDGSGSEVDDSDEDLEEEMEGEDESDSS